MKVRGSRPRQERAAEHVERGLGRLPLHCLAPAREAEAARLEAGPPPGEATPTNTVPTGFAGVPPSGPAMPVMATPQAVPPMRQMPRGHGLRHRRAHRAMRAR